MSTRYETTEDAIVARLLETEGEGETAVETPFRSASVVNYGSQMTDAEILDEIEKLRNVAPSAMVFYLGSQFSGTGVLDEVAEFAVIVIASGVSKVGALRADNGVYGLVEWAQRRLHNYRDDAGGIQNPMRIVRQTRLGEMGRPVTAAAMMLVFAAPMDRTW